MCHGGHAQSFEIRKCAEFVVDGVVAAFWRADGVGTAGVFGCGG